MRKLRVLCSGLCAAIFLGIPGLATASGQLTVSPGQLAFPLTTPNAVAAQTLTITNNFDAPVKLETSLAGIDQSNGLFYPTEEIDEVLARQISVTPSELLIDAKQSAVVTVAVSNSPDLSPGGHYATLLLRQSSDTAANNLGIDSAISINLFVEKFGGENKSVRLDNAQFPHTIFTFPSRAKLTFTNNGNMLVIPRAAVRLTAVNDEEKIIGVGTANTDSQPLLPGKTLVSESQIRLSGRMWLPGRYTATVQYRADGIEGSESLTKTYWYIPPYLILIPLGIFLLYRLLRKQLKKTRQKSRKSIATKQHKDKVQTPKPEQLENPSNDKIHVRVVKKVNVRVESDKTEDS